MDRWYSDMLNGLSDHCGCSGWTGKAIYEIEKDISCFKNHVFEVFSPHCSIRLHTLKLQLPYHTYKDLRKFRSMTFTDTSPFEHSNLHANKSSPPLYLYDNDNENGGNGDMHGTISELDACGPHEDFCKHLSVVPSNREEPLHDNFIYVVHEGIC